MGKQLRVDALVLVNELSDAGKMVIEAAKSQSELLNNSLAPKNGKINLDLWEGFDFPSDDMLIVRLTSTISWRERCVRYGFPGLSKSDISHMGEYGLPIPTEEFMDRMETACDDPNCLRQDHYFEVSRESAEAYVQGKITGAEVINELGEEVIQFCDKWKFELV